MSEAISAETGNAAVGSELGRYFQKVRKLLAGSPRLLLGGAALVLAVVIVTILWAQHPDDKVLFANLSDQDGGAITAALDQMNIPYTLTDNGATIMVPKAQVYRTRLALASQGLPKGGTVGYELLDNQKFGASQFTEQVNYQRALEGELARSIESIQSVKSARVLLALPKQSLFIREQRRASASILLNLYPGRALGAGQADAIAWLVASSVPDLAPEDVSIIDQNGRLLSANASDHASDPAAQARQIEQETVQRILTLLTPMVGAGNVQAQANADLDFSKSEQTSETYRPNQDPNQAAVRSKQTRNEATYGADVARGVPGALSNQAPLNPTAPIQNPPARQNGNQQNGNQRNGAQQQNGNPQNGAAQQQNGTQQQNGATVVPSTNRQESTINYEVDRTIAHIQQQSPVLKRLTVAVVLNDRTDAAGRPQPRSQPELDKIDALVKQAVGYNPQRGDTVTIANVAFDHPQEKPVPLWKEPATLALAREIGIGLLLLAAALLAWRKFRPRVEPPAATGAEPVPGAAATPGSGEPAAADKEDPAKKLAEAKIAKIRATFEDNVKVAQAMATDDPRAVAMIIRSWMEKDEKKDDAHQKE